MGRKEEKNDCLLDTLVIRVHTTTVLLWYRASLRAAVGGFFQDACVGQQ